MGGQYYNLGVYTQSLGGQTRLDLPLGLDIRQSTISITRAGHSNVSRSCWLTSLMFGAPKIYWGPNATKKEGKGDSSFPLVRT